MKNTATSRIDLAALQHNLAMARHICPRSRVMAVVKANAYGHGLLPCARALHSADGLAVARLTEALALRRAGITQRILLLGSLLDPADLAQCAQLEIDVCAHDRTSVARVAAAAREKPLRVWLKLDSGMRRLGLDPEGFAEADRLLSAHSGVRELVHMTHFSSAEEPDPATLDSQLEIFNVCHKQNPRAPASLANSAALLSRPETHADWVRPGIMLYGANPLPDTTVPIRPVMCLVSRILAIREVAPGDAVGYNGRWTAQHRSRIATVGIGYADGYPRHVPNGTPVWINGQFARVAGRVSMDSVGIDISDFDGLGVGDEVVLWGEQLPVATIAERAGSIHYALLAGLTERVSREYTDNERDRGTWLHCKDG